MSFHLIIDGDNIESARLPIITAMFEHSYVVCRGELAPSKEPITSPTTTIIPVPGFSQSADLRIAMLIGEITTKEENPLIYLCTKDKGLMGICQLSDNVYPFGEQSIQNNEITQYLKYCKSSSSKVFEPISDILNKLSKIKKIKKQQLIHCINQAKLVRIEDAVFYVNDHENTFLETYNILLRAIEIEAASRDAINIDKLTHIYDSIAETTNLSIKDFLSSIGLQISGNYIVIRPIGSSDGALDKTLKSHFEQNVVSSSMILGLELSKKDIYYGKRLSTHLEKLGYTVLCNTERHGTVYKKPTKTYTANSFISEHFKKGDIAHAYHLYNMLSNEEIYTKDYETFIKELQCQGHIYTASKYCNNDQITFSDLGDDYSIVLSLIRQLSQTVDVIPTNVLQERIEALGIEDSVSLRNKALKQINTKSNKGMIKFRHLSRTEGVVKYLKAINTLELSVSFSQILDDILNLRLDGYRDSSILPKQLAELGITNKPGVVIIPDYEHIKATIEKALGESETGRLHISTVGKIIKQNNVRTIGRGISNILPHLGFSLDNKYVVGID